MKLKEGDCQIYVPQARVHAVFVKIPAGDFFETAAMTVGGAFLNTPYPCPENP